MAEVEWERADNVLVVTLNRPEKRNAIGGAMLRLLREAFLAAADDDTIRAVVTTGAGDSFCVGADISKLDDVARSDEAQTSTSATPTPDRGGSDNGLRPLSPSEKIVDRLGPGRWMAEMLNFGKPTIAAVNGAAAGGGLCLAVLHDFRVATAGAKFAAGFVALGLAPEMGLSALLPDLVGSQAARRILVLNERVTAEQALALGLVDQMTEGSALDAALEMAHRLAALPPLAVRATLDLLGRVRTTQLQQVLEAEYGVQRILFGTDDHRAAVEAFSTRRAVTFHGR